MSGKFSMADYVDVAERIREFSEKYPEGSLQSELNRLDDGWLCRAQAFRTPDDPRPGVGHAFEPVPGKTPYTKDSEAMNAETSAWGRAIVALGFETKKIASAQEVRARKEPAAKPTPKKAVVDPSYTVPPQLSSFKPPPERKPTDQEIATLMELADRLVDSNQITRKQLDNAAGGTFMPAGLSADAVLDLTRRLETYEKNLAA